MRRYLTIWLCMAAFSFLAVAACGKKEPPFLPVKETVSLHVVNVKGEVKNGKIILKGQIQGVARPGQARDHVQGCRVRYAQFPLDDPPCAGCPIKYQGAHILGPEVITDAGFQCEVPAKKRGQVYFFDVVLLGKTGPLGPRSYRTVVTVKK
ncbi:hypothetical protein ACFL4N_08610 [Thermodesulfobacteriota bacterium]